VLAAEQVVSNSTLRRAAERSEEESAATCEGYFAEQGKRAKRECSKPCEGTNKFSFILFGISTKQLHHK